MSERITDAELQEMKQRTGAATPGPWYFSDEGDWSIKRPPNDAGFSEIIVSGLEDLDEEINPYYDTIGRREDGEFIAAARQDVPRLIEEVERLRAENEGLRDLLHGAKEIIEECCFLRDGPSLDDVTYTLDQIKQHVG